MQKYVGLIHTAEAKEHRCMQKNVDLRNTDDHKLHS